jgi:hypothetical protein
MNLNEIQTMWNQDSKIDIDNLQDESLKISSLHAKYYEIYNNLLLLRKKQEQENNKLLHEKYEYYTGKADKEVYEQNPYDKKIRDKDHLEKTLSADKQLGDNKLQVMYYDTMLKYLEDIIKMIHNRGFQIKNSIEYIKFTAGF